MEIELIYNENGEIKNIKFQSYEAIGYWICNNYENKIIDIITMED